MKRRQTSVPTQWLVADDRIDDALWRAVRRLPRGSGVLVLYRELPKRERSRLLSKLRILAGQRRLTIVDEQEGGAARIHNLAELRRAGMANTPLLFLSPIYPTRSHHEWTAVPRLKAAGIVKLARVPVIALGGMDERRFRRIERLGFSGWAGIDAWIQNLNAVPT